MRNSKLTSLVILLTATLFFSLSSIAQEKKTHDKWFGGYGYFLGGYHSFNLDALNDDFKAAGYPTVNSGSATLGGGGHYLLNNWLIGGEGHGLLGGTAENENYRTVYAGGYGFFNIGYLAVRSPRFNLYPMLGLGGGNFTLYLKDKNLFTDDFEEVLEQPARESIFATGGFLINMAVSAHYLIAGDAGQNGSGGFILGFKAGYILNASGDNWYLSGQKLNNMPAAGMSGPYVSVVIGGGGMGKSD